MTSSAALAEKAKVLVRLPNWLGDIILCTPSLKAISTARPGWELTALVKPGLKDVVRTLPGIADVEVTGGTTLQAVRQQAKDLKRARFDAAIIFPKGFREALLARLAGIPVRCGLSTDHRSFLLTHPVPFTKEDWHLHHAKQFAKTLLPFGVTIDNEPLSFPLTDDDNALAEKVLSEAGLLGKPFAVFHIGASKPPRAWHAERFGEVGKAILERKGLTPVLVGGPGDDGAHAPFREVCPKAVDLAGKTSLRSMAAVVSRAALFVGNDSGPMHVAAAVGVPVVAVFGPGAPHKTEPYLPSARFRVIYASLPCSPCRQAFWQECQPSKALKPPCLEAISPEAVLLSCEKLLANKS
ncbi:MAG: lipopolysaccharide heptosyltransferase II [Acidobacteria bacterium]|nr:lipopolysaccharide heptosyltransferase II [Acidobacteriota bacterium]